MIPLRSFLGNVASWTFLAFVAIALAASVASPQAATQTTIDPVHSTAHQPIPNPHTDPSRHTPSPGDSAAAGHEPTPPNTHSPRATSANPNLDPRTTTLYLTSQRGNVGETGIRDARLLGPNLTGSAEQVVFSPALAGSDVGDHKAHWFDNRPAPDDRTFTGDGVVDLYFTAQASGVSQITVDLVALAPDGVPRLLGTDTKLVSLPTLATAHIAFQMPLQDAVVTTGQFLQLSITVDGLTVAAALEHDSTDAPSAIRLPTALLDSDGDGIADQTEVQYGTDPLDRNDPGDAAPDSDSDGLPDALEAQIGTNPSAADSDGDGVGDGIEHRHGGNPLDATIRPPDTDGDGLPDAWEQRHGLPPDNPDVDGDGITDGLEDSDGDGLTNIVEAAWGTDPRSSDSDGDGVSDGEELARGTDPGHNPQTTSNGNNADRMELILAPLLFAATAGLAATGILGRHAL